MRGKKVPVVWRRVSNCAMAYASGRIVLSCNRGLRRCICCRLYKSYILSRGFAGTIFSPMVCNSTHAYIRVCLIDFRMCSCALEQTRPPLSFPSYFLLCWCTVRECGRKGERWRGHKISPPGSNPPTNRALLFSRTEAAAAAAAAAFNLPSFLSASSFFFALRRKW